MLAAEDRVRSYVNRRIATSEHGAAHEWWTVFPVFLAAIYGGYSAGVSVIILAVLGLVLDDNLTRLNVSQTGAGICRQRDGGVLLPLLRQVVWAAAVVMAGAAVLGGVLGGRVAGRIRRRPCAPWS